ncbi:MAG TPA: aminopeptidase [Firmicutes bacterium]|nr:aminopeptidase [Bacillota bacterium]
MQKKLQEYADIIVGMGVNLQKEQTLVISAPIECVEFVRMISAAAYRQGAREVVYHWNDDQLTRQKYLHADSSVFDTIPAWRQTFYEEYSTKGAAFLSLYAEDPENLKGVDPDRMQRFRRANGEALKEFYRREMENEIPWCVVSLPTYGWAKRVFPDVSAEEAMVKLWNVIFKVMRIGEGTAEQAWQKHLRVLQEHADFLNQQDFRYLHYQNALGTDLMVELPDNHIWTCGGEKTKSGQKFVPNMPTEEIFTAPKRDGVNGVLFGSKPLAESGNIIDGIRFEFQDGKIVRADATRGQEYLRQAITVDAGASYLGEVALVPYESPISQSGILFYNTLFDENASCHFAFGEAYKSSVKGGEYMTEEEQRQAGLNMSLTHVDFMVGTPDLQIIGIRKDGTEVPVFINGNFAG